MLPLATRRGQLVFFGILGMWSVGLIGASWPATALASAMAVLLAAALAATLPLGRRVRSERLEFAWWLSHGNGPISGAVVPGVPFQVRCYVRHRGESALDLAAIEPILPGAAEVLDPLPSRLHVAPRSRTEFSLSLCARAAGRVVLHGMSVHLPGPLGLFEVPLYFPNSLVIKVLPRTVALTQLPLPRVTGLPLDRAGRHRLHRRGGGTELHELRELMPGDPFKSIAWKASAKHGQLMVREVDQEVQQTVVLVLDASGSMRGGEPGHRKLDLALELVAAEARAWLERGDRVGLVTVDGSLLHHVPPFESISHLVRIYDALLAVTEVVDPEATAVDDREVVAIVGRYVRHQDGVDYSRAKGTQWDAAALAAHVRASTPKKGTRRARMSGPALASELRRYCLERGIALPHRPSTAGTIKAQGLCDALLLAAGKTRAARYITLISDLDGVSDFDPLLSTARVIQKRGNTFGITMPDAIEIHRSETAEGISTTLRTIYGMAEQRRQRDARDTFGRIGVRVAAIGPAAFRTPTGHARPVVA